MTDQSSIATRRKPAPSDIIGTAIVGLVGAAALVTGWGYGFLQESGEVGAGFLPVVTGGFIFLASLAELIRMYYFSQASDPGFMSVAEKAEKDAQAAMTDNRAPAAQTDADDDDAAEQHNLTTIKVFGLLLAALLLIPAIGLLLSLSAMVLIIVLWVERKPLVPAIVTAAAVLGLAYLIFIVLLNVPLPQGMLGLI